MKLRKHQQEIEKIALDLDAAQLPVKILAWVVPGGGKSLLPMIIANKFPSFKLAWFVPRLSLKRQAAQDMAKHGIRLMETDAEWNPSKNERGFIATHQSLALNPRVYADELERNPYILIVDEIHHAKIFMSGEQNQLASALDQLDYKIRLDMTGTLETNDNSMIHGIEYQETPEGLIPNPDESADHFVRYSRESALLEDAIVPVEFQHHDGHVKYADKDGESEEILLSAASRADESKVIFAALNTKLADDLFERGLSHWREHGDQLIVVTASQSHARRYHKVLEGQGIRSAMAVTDNPAAHAEVEQFRTKAKRALVTCAMAYEGLDAPATSHVICLTHIRSVPWIEQMLGRAWRRNNGKKMCWAFVPDDTRMMRVIDRIRREQILAIRTRESAAGGAGEDRDIVVAIGGVLESVYASRLDGDIGAARVRDEIMAVLSRFGFDGSEDVVARLIEQAEIRFRSISTTAETPAQERKRLSNEIAKTLRGANYEKGQAWGYFEKLLMRETRKSLEDMTIEELTNAAQIAARICA